MPFKLRSIGIFSLFCIFTWCVVGSAASRKSGFSFELFTGTALNMDSQLGVYQSGQPFLEFQAKWDSNPFEDPYYYAARAVYWQGDSGWGVEFVHHKLYLANLPPEIQTFTITDGYNFLTLQRLWRLGNFVFSLGSGVVITHPESRIRGESFTEDQGVFGSGYHISGPAGVVGLGYRIEFTSFLFLNIEGKLFASYVNIPVANGFATLNNFSAHALVGFGVQL